MRTRIVLLVGGVIASVLAVAAPAQAGLDGITISKSGTTVTVEVDCTKSYATPWPEVTLTPGDTLALKSKYAKGVTGECTTMYADGSVTISDFFVSPFGLNATVALDADTGLSYVSKSTAPWNNMRSGDLWLVLFGAGEKGQHMNIMFATPTYTVTAAASPVSYGTVSASDSNSDGIWDLTATPAAGYGFSGWSCSASQTPRIASARSTTVTPTANTTCTATFAVAGAFATRTELSKGTDAVVFTTNIGSSNIAALFIDGELVDQTVSDAATLSQYNFLWCRFDGLGDVTEDRTLTYRVYSTTTSFTPTFASAYAVQAQITLIGDPNGCGPLLPNLTGALAEGINGQPYSVSITNPDAGWQECYSVTLSVPALPVGLSLGENGTISGTPTAAGTSTFTVECLWGEGDVATKQYSIVVRENSPVFVFPALTPASAPTIAATTAGKDLVLTCLAPVFTPAAKSVTYAWIHNGIEVSTSTALTVTPGTSSSEYTCRVTGSAQGGFHSISSTYRVPAVTTSGSGPVVAVKTATFSVSFASKSATVEASQLRALRAFVARLENVSSVAVTGYVQATRITTNDQQLSASRAKNVASALLSLGVKGAYTVTAGGRSALAGAKGRVVTLTVVSTSTK